MKFGKLLVLAAVIGLGIVGVARAAADDPYIDGVTASGQLAGTGNGYESLAVSAVLHAQANNVYAVLMYAQADEAGDWVEVDGDTIATDGVGSGAIGMSQSNPTADPNFNALPWAYCGWSVKFRIYTGLTEFVETDPVFVTRVDRRGTNE